MCNNEHGHQKCQCREEKEYSIKKAGEEIEDLKVGIAMAMTTIIQCSANVTGEFRSKPGRSRRQVSRGSLEARREVPSKIFRADVGDCKKRWMPSAFWVEWRPGRAQNPPRLSEGRGLSSGERVVLRPGNPHIHPPKLPKRLLTSSNDTEYTGGLQRESHLRCFERLSASYR